MTGALFLGGAIAVPVVMTAPGYLVLRRLGWSPNRALTFATPMAAAVMAAVVALAVVSPFSTTTVCRIAAVVTTVVLVATLRRVSFRDDLSAIAAPLAITLLVYTAAAAFVSVPSRPWYEPASFTLIPERAETPRLPGSPVDSHLPYRTAQVATHKLGGAEIRDRFTVGWWLTDRTPLLGLDFAFLAALFPVDLPRDDPSTRGVGVPMATVDPIGYWLYLLFGAWLGASALLSLFGVARFYVSPKGAIASMALAGLAPGVFVYAVHPRPSLAVTTFVLAAVAAALDRRPALAGAAVALGYLAHPTGAWWAVPVAAILVSQGVPRRAGIVFPATAALVVAPWQAFSAFVVGASSRMVSWPLGSTLRDPTNTMSSLDQAWGAFLERGFAVNLFVRISAFMQAIVPVNLFSIPSPSPRGTNEQQAWALWVAGHALSAIGITGLVLSGAVLVGCLRTASDVVRRDTAVVTVSLFAVGVILEGSPESWLFKGLIGLSFLWTIPAALALSRCRPVVRTVIAMAAAVELWSVVWGPGMFVPYASRPMHIIAVLGIAVASTLALVAMAVGSRSTERLPRLLPPSRSVEPA